MVTFFREVLEKKIVILTDQNIRVKLLFPLSGTSYSLLNYLLFINLESGMNDAANREMSAKLSTEHITASTTLRKGPKTVVDLQALIRKTWRLK